MDSHENDQTKLHLEEGKLKLSKHCKVGKSPWLHVSTKPECPPIRKCLFVKRDSTLLYSSYSDMLQILLGRCVWSGGGWWKTMWWFLSWWYLLSSTCVHRWSHRDRTTRHWVIIKKIFQNGRNITSNFRSIQAECTRLNVTCTCKREPSEVCVKFTKFSK